MEEGVGEEEEMKGEIEEEIGETKGMRYLRKE